MKKHSPMKRHTKLFEEFAKNDTLWALLSYTNRGMFGLYDTEQEAIQAEREIREYLIADGQWGELDEIDVTPVTLGKGDYTDARMLDYATAWDRIVDFDFPGQPPSMMVRKLIDHGVNPFARYPGLKKFGRQIFSGPEELERFFIDRAAEEEKWIANEPNRRRSKKSRSLFGI